MATLRDLVAQRDLGLAGLCEPNDEVQAISWASSSDLVDPTPFLVADQLLLTTGLQFAEDAVDSIFKDYVARLKDHQVLGIGFGTEVLRTGTPAALVEACRAARMPLVEVPYSTPFLAIIRWVARDIERVARQRDDWALAAMRGISAAALSRGDVGAVLRELANRLEARVALFDADGTLECAHPKPRSGGIDPTVAAGVRRLLASGGRAADEVGDVAAVTVLQTIGPSGELAGVLTVTGPRPDRAARSVLSTAVALVEVGVAASRHASKTNIARNSVLLRLLRDGRADLARDIAAAFGIRTPTSDAVVISAAPRDPAMLSAVAEREARADDRLVVSQDGRMLCLVPTRAAAAMAVRLSSWASGVGTAGITGIGQLESGIARADSARRAAADGGTAAWEELPSSGDITSVVRYLSPLATVPDGADRIEAAETWFEQNCAWGPAARQLGLHPHTVRDRVMALAAAVGVDVDFFEGRATLWAALRAFRLGTDQLASRSLSGLDDSPKC